MFYLDVPFMCIYALVSIINNTIQYNIYLYINSIQYIYKFNTIHTEYHFVNHILFVYFANLNAYYITFDTSTCCGYINLGDCVSCIIYTFI